MEANTEKTQKKLEFTKTLHGQSCIAGGITCWVNYRWNQRIKNSTFFFGFPHFCRPPIGISIPSVVG